jgi:acetamidase/formamidase
LVEAAELRRAEHGSLRGAVEKRVGEDAAMMMRQGGRMPHVESGRMHRLGQEAVHTYWDHALPPRLTVELGDTVVFKTLEPSQGAVARNIAAGTWQVPAADPDLVAVVVASASPEASPDSADEERGHALTGPVAVVGAEPGDTLVVDVVEVVPAAWGWTACGPGTGGALLQDELEEWILHVWDLRDGEDAVFAPGIRVPLAPFCGVMGVAPAESGPTPRFRRGGSGETWMCAS